MTKGNAKIDNSKFRVLGLLALVVLFPRSITRAQQGQTPLAERSSAGTAPEKMSAQQGEGPDDLHLMVGRSLLISSPARIKRVSVADPGIVDTVIVNPKQLLINGKAPGAASLVLWDESGQSQTFDAFVDLDVLALNRKVREVFPDQPVRVEASRDAVLLSGKVSSQAVADKILEIAKATSPKTISLMQVPAAPSNGEILLQVKFAEVDRAAISQLGVNIMSLPPAKNVFTTSTQQFAPPQLQTGQALTGKTGGFTLSDLLNVFIFRPDINLAATIKALQQRNLLEILAEPNLLTQTGKEGSFLAGGEFPYPIVQPGAGGFSTVTIAFKEFGIRLNFVPTLTVDGAIHLKVRPEVSALDFTNALTISGFLLPALSTRRVESEMELKDGQSFAIAGLVDNRVTEQFQKIPGIGDIPVLGKLFQSRTLNKARNELLVLVTPRIVQPSPPGPLPAGPQFPKPFLPPLAPQKPAPAK